MAERNHETLISRLNKDNRDIFVFLKDTMIFSAMIGYHYAEKRPLKGGTIEILLETYATDEKDSFIYLLSLLEERDALILKDDRLKGSVSVFEEYCNAGLYQIESWLDENPGDPSGVDTLLDKIYERTLNSLLEIVLIKLVVLFPCPLGLATRLQVVLLFSEL